MKQLSMSEIKEAELSLLLRFADICDRNGLKYFLIFGTLLGAVRHKGFIPWDDDIDVCMPRTDYDRFIELERKEKEIDFVCIDDNTSSQPFIKLIDLTTEITEISENMVDAFEVSHLWVDVFPLDYMPDDIDKYMRAFKHVKFLRQLSVYSISRYGAGSSRSKAILKIPVIFLCKRIGRFRIAHWIDNYCRKLSPPSNHVNTLCWGARGIEAHSDISMFRERVQLEFEGYRFWAPKAWDKYLNDIYGEYMKLPPKEKQVGHHMVVVRKETN